MQISCIRLGEQRLAELIRFGHHGGWLGTRHAQWIPLMTPTRHDDGFTSSGNSGSRPRPIHGCDL